MESKKYWNQMTKKDIEGAKFAIKENINNKFKPNPKAIELIVSAIRFGSNNKIKIMEIQEWLGRNKIKLSHYEIRKQIQHIRENNSTYLDFGYISADSKGYWISTEVEKLTIYQNAMNKRYRSLALQQLELAEVIKRAKEE